MTNTKLSGGFGRALRDWFGFGPQLAAQGHDHGHDHGHGGGHGHTHGVIDPTIATTERGIWAIKWSFIILAITAALQLMVVAISGSVALLADTIHNVGDAGTAIPLWIAFVLARRKPSAGFTYGYGRAEDLAGAAIVAIILFSALVAGYEAIDRLIHPQPITNLAWVAIAGIVGFVGNEAVAIFRIRVGREINSAALIADGYHARTDGLTSLAVVLGAFGVWLGFPLADPLVGLLITVAIFGIVWQSSKAVFTRMLDGVEPEVIDEIRHAAEHVPGIRAVLDAKARWLGHRLVAEVDMAVDGNTTVSAADGLAASFEQELKGHLPALLWARIRIRSADGAQIAPITGHGHHHHAPEPFSFKGDLAAGTLAIVDTGAGERFRLLLMGACPGLEATVIIDREDQIAETVALEPLPERPEAFQSVVAPAEPHEFSAALVLKLGSRTETLPFTMEELHAH